MFYSIFKLRKSKGAKPANFHESTTVEIVWTIVPFVIVIFMALPATKVVVAMKDTSATPTLRSRPPAIQWKWGYDYLKGEGEGIGFISTLDIAQRESCRTPASRSPVDDYLLKVDNPLVVPMGKKVRIITTATDVIHAFMVPSFGIKQDAIPGFVRDTWFKAEKTGDFYGQCAELCGKEHAYMPIHVKVLSAAVDYAAWVDTQEEGNGRACRRSGEGVDAARSWSREARRSTPRTAPPATSPTARAVARSRRSMPIRSCNDPDHTEAGPRRCCTARTMARCRRGNSSPDTEIAAVVTYTKNNWSNKTGQLVQPSPTRPGRSFSPPMFWRNRDKSEHRRTAARHRNCHDECRYRPPRRPRRPRRCPRGHDDHASRRAAWLAAAGSSRRTTRTSARCTCCSRSRC